MMRKYISVLLVLALSVMMFAGCTKEENGSTKEKEEQVKVGITVQSLENDYWEGVMEKLSEIMVDAGWEYEIVSCEDNAVVQISQIQDFVDAECDVIMVHPSDAASVEKICGEAVLSGIKVMCWDNPMENTTVNWVLDNTELGVEIGKATAEFINTHYTEEFPAKVVTIGYPSTTVLLERENGIIAGIEENCTEGIYEIVGSIEGLEANQAFENCESILAAYPEVNVFAGVGAGAMLGANEALLAKYGGAGSIPEYVGVIGTDVTVEQLDALASGEEAIRAIIGFEGSSYDTAKACFEMFERILGGEEYAMDTKNIKRPIQLITTENIDMIMEGM